MNHKYKINKDIIEAIDINNSKLLRDVLISQIDTNKPIGLFAYGSLLWDTPFEYTSKTECTLPNYKRQFCFHSTIARGTPENPGLLLALVAAEGSHCQGINYLFEYNDKFKEAFLIYLKREIMNTGYVPIWQDIETDVGIVQSMLLVMNTESSRFQDIELSEQFSMISKAKGKRGTNLEYLINTCHSISDFNIVDRDMLTLLNLAEIQTVE